MQLSKNPTTRCGLLCRYYNNQLPKRVVKIELTLTKGVVAPDGRPREVNNRDPADDGTPLLLHALSLAIVAADGCC